MVNILCVLKHLMRDDMCLGSEVPPPLNHEWKTIKNDIKLLVLKIE
jgi:hypothetical protein